ncbi:hypothetical protein NQ318_004469 [Aromia moschata]|uniref:Mos1 transposase HTH domain-containing protein n=1 Tax=Aromia moschata TaxID=1265417 RepID=A0AAV8YAQ2_9CUCU|nr:hypothetical protein NQ318_004469 [Aromia moschata]
MLSVQMDQRFNLKFLVKLGKPFTEAYAMLKEVYGNECLYRTQVSEWFKRFKEGRETTENDLRPGQPSTSKTDENVENIDRRLRIRGLAEIIGIDKVCTKVVPKLLTPEQKESRMNICADILNNIDTDPGLLDTVTLKETILENVEAVKAKATEVVNQLTEADFQHCFRQRKSRMERCRDRRGEYIEGENYCNWLLLPIEYDFYDPKVHFTPKTKKNDFSKILEWCYPLNHSVDDWGSWSVKEAILDFFVVSELICSNSGPKIRRRADIFQREGVCECVWSPRTSERTRHRRGSGTIDQRADKNRTIGRTAVSILNYDKQICKQLKKTTIQKIQNWRLVDKYCLKS